MSTNDETDPLINKDVAKTEYTAEGEAAGGKHISNIIYF